MKKEYTCICGRKFTVDSESKEDLKHYGHIDRDSKGKPLNDKPRPSTEEEIEYTMEHGTFYKCQKC